MKYYAVSMGNYTTLIIKTELAPHQLLDVLTSHRAIQSTSGAYHNLKNYESFHEVSTPDERMKKVALTLDRIS